MFQSWVVPPVRKSAAKHPRRRTPLALERCEERLPPGQLLDLLADPFAAVLGPALAQQSEISLWDDARNSTEPIRPLGGMPPAAVPAPNLRAAATAPTIRQGSPPQSATGAWAGAALGDSWAGDLLDAADALAAPGRGWRVSDLWNAQVNVDAQGNNIVGDAANEPSLAVDPTDPRRMVIGWRQFDSVKSNFRQAGWGYSHDAGRAWTFPGVIEPGVFRSDPVLDFDADGNFYYNSLTTNPYVTTVFKSTDGGVSWDQGTFAYGGDKQWMVIDRTNGPGRGNIYADWNRQFTTFGGDFTRSTNGGASFTPPISMPGNLIWGTLAVGPESQLYIGGRNGNNFVTLRSTNAHDPDVTPTFASTTVNLGGPPPPSGGAPNPGGLLGQAWIATDLSSGPSRGNVYLLSPVNPPGADPLDVMIARSTDGGVTFGPPVRVNDDPSAAGAWQWFAAMSVAPNGRIDVVWVDTRSTLQPNLGQLYYASSIDAGATWSPNVAVSPLFDSHVGWPQQNKLGDYYQTVSDDKGVNVAYAATFNNEQDVYFLRINVEPTSLV